MELTKEQENMILEALDKNFNKYKEIAGLTEADREVFKRGYFLGFLDACDAMKKKKEGEK